MRDDVQRIAGRFESALIEADPLEALTAITEMRHALDMFERAHVTRALASGATFTAIAAPLAISRHLDAL